MKGKIVKGIAGFYYVKVGKTVFQCKARGIFKKEQITPTVGDLAEIQVLEDGDAVINKIFPRKNLFIRPPVANVDMIAVVTAAKDPDPNLRVIDKLLVTAEKSQTDIILCINKMDLVEDKESATISHIYKSIYPIVFLSCNEDKGLDVLKDVIADKAVALAGPSGVGKSTILNKLQPDIKTEIGEISQKTQRGKHTTRHVELFETDFGAHIYDTPGFTSFEIADTKEEELAQFYPEMVPFLGQCRYADCSHINEPDCMVKEAVESGDINRSRYDSYRAQYEELKKLRKY